VVEKDGKSYELEARLPGILLRGKNFPKQLCKKQKKKKKKENKRKPMFHACSTSRKICAMWCAGFLKAPQPNADSTKES
jgi:hypothetical protein